MFPSLMSLSQSDQLGNPFPVTTDEPPKLFLTEASPSNPVAPSKMDPRPNYLSFLIISNPVCDPVAPVLYLV